MAKKKPAQVSGKKTLPQKEEPRTGMPLSTQTIYWFLLILLLVFVAGIRFRMLSLPLERDEGEYAYMGQLLLKGYAPFSHAYNMKFPGTSIMYALFMFFFGQTSEGVHLGFFVINAGSIIILFVAARRFLGNMVAIVAAATYALISMSPALFGSAAHATHYVILFALAGLYLLLVALERQKKMQFFLSGLLLGFGILMKQPGIFFALFGGLIFIYDQFLMKKIAWTQTIWKGFLMATGIVLPIALLFLWVYAAGTFDRFWFWTFEYGGQYATTVGFTKGIGFLRDFADSLQAGFLWLWVMALPGLVFLWTGNYHRAIKLFLTAFLVISFLAVSPGLYFRGHYFILFLPAVALLTGICIAFTGNYISERLQRPSLAWIPSLLFLLVCIFGIVRLKTYFFKANMSDLSHMIYGNNPFPESIPIARYVKNNTTQDDKIAVVGSEPQIYFYADRLSATGFIYTYSLMEPQPYNIKMQQEMIEEIEAAKPKMLVFCKVPQSWTVRDDSPDTIFNWFDRYDKGYDFVGAVEIPRVNEKAAYYWDNDINRFQSRSDYEVYVFRRKDQ